MNTEHTDNELSLDDIFSRMDSDEQKNETSRVPFKFLDSYQKEDADIFFGRDEEIEDIFRKFYLTRLLLVYGRSGTGKSSVISCGLLNKIPQEDIFPIKIRCGKDPFQNFVQDISKHAKKEDGTDAMQILTNLCQRTSKPLLLMFDQFEEIFILSTVDKRKILVDFIKQLVKSKLRINLVFVIREEYLANLTELETVLPQLFQNRIRIERLHHQKAKEVIEQPCKVCGVDMEPNVAELIIDRLTDDKGTLELTYLQVIMDRLYKKAQTAGKDKITIRKKHFDELKSIGNVLTQYLDEQLQNMSNAEEGEQVLKTMISADGTKRRMTMDEIAENLKVIGKQLPDNVLKDTISYFINARIITDKDENNNYELRHDSLAARIYERLTALEKELIEVRKFIENAFQNFRTRKKYLDPADLKYLALYEDKLYLKEDVKQFIKESKRLAEQKRRLRMQLIAAATILLLLIFAGFTVWALNERSKAETAKTLAEEAKTKAVVEESKAKKALADLLEKERLRKYAEVGKIVQKIGFLMSMNDAGSVENEIKRAREIDSTDVRLIEKIKEFRTTFN